MSISETFKVTAIHWEPATFGVLTGWCNHVCELVIIEAHYFPVSTSAYSNCSNAFLFCTRPHRAFFFSNITKTCHVFQVNLPAASACPPFDVGQTSLQPLTTVDSVVFVHAFIGILCVRVQRRGRERDREHSSIINAGVDYLHRGKEFKLV